MSTPVLQRGETLPTSARPPEQRGTAGTFTGHGRSLERVAEPVATATAAHQTIREAERCPLGPHPDEKRA